MPLQLPQSYKFKFFYSSRNPIATNALLIIDDHNGASSSHATFPSSPPLFLVVLIFQIMFLFHHPLTYFLLAFLILQIKMKLLLCL
jgi:hypothetical protein